MEDQLTNQEASEPQMGVASLFTKVITEPARAFENIRLYPTWLFPILLSILLGIVTVYLTKDLQAAMSKKYIMESEKIPEEQKDKILESMDNPSIVRSVVFPSLGVLVFSFAAPAVIALGLLVFGNFIFGGSVPFKTLFCASSWAGVIGILEAIIKVPLMLSKGSMEVYTSLALLLDESESKTLLFGILNAVDIFAIWKIVVYATAFSVIYKFGKQKGYTAVIALYVLFVIITIGFKQLSYSFM